MSQQRIPSPWRAAAPADVRASFVREADEYRSIVPGSEQRDRMWQQLQAMIEAPAARPLYDWRGRWRWPWIAVGTVLLLSTGALLSKQPRRSRPVLRSSSTLTAPAAAPKAEPALPTPEVTPDATVHVRAVSSVRQHTPSSPRAQPARLLVQPQSPVPALNPNAELELLVHARRLVRSAPDRALALAEQHRSAFEHGVFAEERELLAIAALQRLGQRASARERAQRFRVSYPNSAHRGQLTTLSGGE